MLLWFWVIFMEFYERIAISEEFVSTRITHREYNYVILCWVGLPCTVCFLVLEFIFRSGQLISSNCVRCLVTKEAFNCSNSSSLNDISVFVRIVGMEETLCSWSGGGPQEETSGHSEITTRRHFLCKRVQACRSSKSPTILTTRVLSLVKTYTITSQNENLPLSEYQ